MRLHSLYLKFLIYFILLLLITLALLGGWFRTTFWEFLEEQEIQDTGLEINLVRNAILVAVDRAPGLPLQQNPYLAVLLESLDEMYDVVGWIELKDGSILTADYNLPLPAFQKEGEGKDYGGGFVVSKVKPLGRYCAHGEMEITMGLHGNATLHTLFERSRLYSQSTVLFLQGLGGVFFIVALLIIPITRLISSPIKRLERAALRYAEGDLSSRAPDLRQDEIGELGRAFNYMAGRIERMIRNTRELAANVSHELRSPLTRLRISEELVREKLEREGGPDVRGYLDSIRAEVDNLDELIARILEFSKLGLTEMSPEGEMLDLDQMVQSVLESYTPMRERKNIGLSTDFCGNAAILGEYNEIVSLLTNLIDNAVKYCPEQGEVSVRTQILDGRVQIRVTNTFERIDEDELACLFEPFYRGASCNHPGFGLGLAMVKRIAIRHAGDVQVVNISWGVRFIVSFPLAEHAKQLGAHHENA